MSDIDKWSDDQLRTKLLEYGFPIMPITGTTRKVMVKKLKLLVENKDKRPDRRSMGQFSSEEDSDVDNRESSKKLQEKRRVTMAASVMPSPKSNRSISKTLKKPSNKDEEKKVSSTTRSAKIISMVEQEETNSDSEPDIVETDYKELESEKEPLPKKDKFEYSPGRYSMYTSSTSKSRAEDSLSQIRSRLSLGSPRLTSYEPEDFSSETTPFLSSFTKKLSQLSDDKDDLLKEHDNGSLVGSSGLFARTKIRKPVYQSSQRFKMSSNYVPFVLIGLLALFFVILAVLYYGMHSGSNSNELIGKTSKYQPQNNA